MAACVGSEEACQNMLMAAHSAGGCNQIQLADGWLKKKKINVCMVACTGHETVARRPNIKYYSFSMTGRLGFTLW